MRTRWAALTLVPLGLLVACTGDRPTSTATPTVIEGAATLHVTDAWTLGDQVTGAIFTTTPDGGIVNENVRYDAKIEVYLDGGPRNQVKATAAGLKDGLYVFQITDPSGKVLLSEDPSKCRVVRVEGGLIKERVAPADFPSSIGGAKSNTFLFVDNPGQQPDVYAPCHLDGPEADGQASSNARHDVNTDVDHGADGALVIQMMPFRDTPNPGGVYKAWMTPVREYLALGGNLEKRPLAYEQKVRGETVGYDRDPGFGPPNAKDKTDNFKVRENPPFIVIRKYEDENANGLLDSPPDALVEGWKVAVIEQVDGGPVTNFYETTTDPIKVPFNSTVRVCEEVVAGWAFAYAYIDAAKQSTIIDQTIGGDAYKCIDVVIGSTATTINIGFGNFDLADKSGIKFHDLNGDGDRDGGEPVLAGWTIHLLNAANAVVATDVTDANGVYGFDGLAAGSYKVCEVQQPSGTPPPTWYQSAPNSGTTLPAGETLVDCDAITASYGPQGFGFVVSSSGQSFTNNDFGNYQNATKSGVKFEDLDADASAREAGEPLLANWEIHLFGTTGLGAAVHLHDVTDANGAYSFSVPPGTYWVCETLKSDWTQSYPKSGVTEAGTCPAHAAGGGGTGAASGWGYDIVLTSGEVDSGNDFGNWEPADISGYKIGDLDANAVKNGLETGLEGWEIHLFGTSGTGAAIHRHDVTDATGQFSFTGVPPGIYRLCESAEAGWIQTYPTAATSGAVNCTTHAAGGGTPAGLAAGTGYGYEVTLVSGDSKTTGFDFLNTPTQGCTPGFWKQEQWFKFWTSPYTPSTLVRSASPEVFTHFTGQGGATDGYDADLTMLGALDLDNSNGIGQVLRHGVAALLNALRSDIAFAFTPSQVRSLVNAALDAYDVGNQTLVDQTHAALAAENQRGCPLGNSTAP